MNIDNEAQQYLIDFLNKVLAENYSRSEWERFSFSNFQNEILERIRTDVAIVIAKNVEPGGFKMKAVSKETRDSIEAIINELKGIGV